LIGIIDGLLVWRELTRLLGNSLNIPPLETIDFVMPQHCLNTPHGQYDILYQTR